MSEGADSASVRLNTLLAEAGLEPLNPAQAKGFESYISLILRWNARINLTAIRDEDDILRRHFVESITCSRSLPAGIHTLLDFGSGAGFPGIPIALCHPEIAVTLAESQGKKAAFLCEVVRQLGLSANQPAEERSALKGHDFSRVANATKQERALAPKGCSSGTSHEIPFPSAGCRIHSGRAEVLCTVFDCVTLRAVDRMGVAVKAAAKLVCPGGWMALMTTGKEQDALKAAAGTGFAWTTEVQLPGSEDRLLALGMRAISSSV